ncbi:MAG: NAD-dependent epimerase/dehydratase family protein [Acetivibrio ethanolgignens]
MKRILITGAGSYIGTSVEKYLKVTGNYKIDTLDMRSDSWKDYDFSGYEVIFHVAGITHADTGKMTKEKRENYYNINTKLALETAKKAKKEGAGQFILMSSMIVYGESGNIGNKRIITKDTEPKPSSVYGNSKWLADKGICKLKDKNFKIVVLRPPMIYGKGSKGNYPFLSKLARYTPVFPDIKNERSMLYIENLCEFVKLMIDNEEDGIFFPQNKEYVKTSDLVKLIAEKNNHRVHTTKVFNLGIFFAAKCSKQLRKIINKVFGNMVYEMSMSEYKGIDYRICDLEQSIERTEEK